MAKLKIKKDGAIHDSVPSFTKVEQHEKSSAKTKRAMFMTRSKTAFSITDDHAVHEHMKDVRDPELITKSNVELSDMDHETVHYSMKQNKKANKDLTETENDDLLWQKAKYHAASRILEENRVDSKSSDKRSTLRKQYSEGANQIDNTDTLCSTFQETDLSDMIRVSPLVKGIKDTKESDTKKHTKQRRHAVCEIDDTDRKMVYNTIKYYRRLRFIETYT